MSMEIYEETMKQLNLYRMLEVSEEQIKEGRTKDAGKKSKVRKENEIWT